MILVTILVTVRTHTNTHHPAKRRKQRVAMRLTHVASWTHGCLFRRPQEENRRSRRKAPHEKERGRLSVRGEPLLSQALREEVSPRKVAFARQSTRQTPEGRRVCQETAGSRPQGAALRQAPPEMRVPQ